MYSREHYLAITENIKTRWHLKNSDVSTRQWMLWQVAIKRLFDKGILISEILAAFSEAEQKGHWPVNTSFFHRVEDIVLKNRLEARPTVKINEGPMSLADLLARRSDKTATGPQ